MMLEETDGWVRGDIMEKLRQALRVAADALNIVADWNLSDIQVNPPKEWGLETIGEDIADGWCSTRQLAAKFRELAEQ